MDRLCSSRFVMTYGLAIVSTVAAILARKTLDPIFGEQYPFITFMFAIILTAWYGGVGPAMVALVLGFMSAAYFFLNPRGSVEVYGVEPQIGMVLYVAVGISSIFFSESMHAANRRVRQSAADLLNKQKELEHEIDERRQAQAAHVDLLRRMVRVQEEERRRISRELHDQCGQEVTAMRLSLKSMEESMVTHAASDQHFENLRKLLDQLARDMHHIAIELRPPVLDDLGLQIAMESYVSSWNRRTGIAAGFACQGLSRKKIPEEVETALYRVLQEALTNVARHAGAKRVSVILEGTEQGIVEIIEDEGQGFDTSTLSSAAELKQHLGVLGMRERIEAFGGSLEIESTIGTGTSVFARIPLNS